MHACWWLWSPILDAQTLLHFWEVKAWVEDDRREENLETMQRCIRHCRGWPKIEGNWETMQRCISWIFFFFLLYAPSCLIFCLCIQFQAARTCVYTSLTWRKRASPASTSCLDTRLQCLTSASTVTRVCWPPVTHRAWSLYGNAKESKAFCDFEDSGCRKVQIVAKWNAVINWQGRMLWLCDRPLPGG